MHDPSADSPRTPSATALLSDLDAAGCGPLESPRCFSQRCAQEALDIVEPYARSLGDPEHSLAVASRLLAMLVVANGAHE